jgi:hypothetical protein
MSSESKKNEDVIVVTTPIEPSQTPMMYKIKVDNSHGQKVYLDPSFKDKPEVTKSIMMTLFNYKNKPSSFIIPLKNFDVYYYEKHVCIKLPFSNDLMKKITTEKYMKCAITMTDDPKIEWAADWSDLGTFRLVFKIMQPTIKKKENELQIWFGRDQFQKDLWMPDKVRWDLGKN